MSGAAAARALEARFHGITRSVLDRHRKKCSRLDAAERAVVAAIAAEVVRAIVGRPVLELSRCGEPSLVRAAIELFGVPAEPDGEETSPPALPY